MKNYQEISIGARAEGGSSVDFNVGSWRAIRPVIDLNKCIHCMLCFLYCPDNSIMIVKESSRLNENPEIVGIDLNHCKGCGICKSVCPVKCITMIQENDALRKDKEAKERMVKG